MRLRHGSGDLWVVLSYDGEPSYAVSIMQFREPITSSKAGGYWLSESAALIATCRDGRFPGLRTSKKGSRELDPGAALRLAPEVASRH
jgi:hypothetical protein